MVPMRVVAQQISGESRQESAEAKPTPRAADGHPDLKQAQDKKAPWPWQASLDAAAAAPVNHKVMYEDAQIRILNVNNQPRVFQQLACAPVVLDLHSR